MEHLISHKSLNTNPVESLDSAARASTEYQLDQCQCRECHCYMRDELVALNKSQLSGHT